MPAGPWGRTWLVTVVIAVVAVVGLERFVRARGYRPSVKDDAYAWAWQRLRASDDSPHTMAILGASRILLAFSPSTFVETLPGWNYVQLAIDGTQPGGALLDLGRDPNFRGVALVDIVENGLAAHQWHRQDAYISAYHRRWREPAAMIERLVQTAIETRLALLSETGARVLATGWSSPPYVTTFADRTQFADYGLTDVAERRRRRQDQVAQALVAPPPTQAEADAWFYGALQLESAIDQIRARGGAVVYVRMPTCDERWAADQKAEPRALFWDRLAARTHAVAIHFADEPTLRDFECPDTSHIASKDGPRFTRALLAILARRGVLPR